ncbi:hypothetical protein SteCoe_21937 [Stentor coeruleus]|uniref:RING-type domain-containing protein n=1 Tax=Stentor coeruleus TaxID=5963 RepID=A0A1R2BNB9_9CILI|nr:hypothetical protein SteCoe_21937 [Stentor coeruleus]
MKVFRCCCFCFTKTKPKPPPEIKESIIIEVRSHEVIEEQQQPPPVHREHKNIVVDTKFKTDDVKFCENTPANTQLGVFSYNCPICLRYFSTILSLKCCKQYICHYCLDDLGKDVKFEVACPHCKAQPIVANDVDFNSTIKRYSDSPYGTLKQSNNNQNNKWVPMHVVKEDNEDNEIEENDRIPESLNASIQPRENRLQMTI